MSYVAAVDRLYALGHELTPAAPGAPRRKFELVHMRVLAESLGNPQRRFRSILIAGTNGKGSTAATLASILACSGCKTGMYTSPHLIQVNERIQVSTPDLPSSSPRTGEANVGPSPLRQISDGDFARIFDRVDKTAQDLVKGGTLPHFPSFFEVLTALAFVYFAEQDVDTAVLEVGLGGRLDATNIVDPLLSIITDIALDHQDYLGTTLTEITREKAGILRPHGTLITLPQHPEANQALGELAANTAGLRAISAADLVPAPNRERKIADHPGNPLLPENSYGLTVDGEPLAVHSPLAGSHQRRNLALAIAAAVELRNRHGYMMPNESIVKGISQTRWPGRLETMGPQLLLDVAHNPAGAWTLRSVVSHLPEDRPKTLVFSCLRDKNIREMTQILFPLFDSSTAGRSLDRVLLAPVENPRGASVDELLAAANVLGIAADASPDLATAWSRAKQITPRHGIIIVTGSIYLVGGIRKLALEEQSASNLQVRT